MRVDTDFLYDAFNAQARKISEFCKPSAAKIDLATTIHIQTNKWLESASLKVSDMSSFSTNMNWIVIYGSK